MKDYRGNFEVHLTVNSSGPPSVLRDLCKAEQCKCVFIVLARGVNVQQPMVSWRCSADTLSQVLEVARARIHRLEAAGVSVTRLKVEADPDNEQVPQNDEDARGEPLSHYFEHHIKLRRRVAADQETLLTVCQDHGAHLSHNALKVSAAGIEERFVTLRSYGIGRSSSEARLHELLCALNLANEEIVEMESEYAVYDSNIALDDGWLQQASQ